MFELPCINIFTTFLAESPSERNMESSHPVFCMSCHVISLYIKDQWNSSMMYASWCHRLVLGVLATSWNTDWNINNSTHIDTHITERRFTVWGSSTCWQVNYPSLLWVFLLLTSFLQRGSITVRVSMSSKAFVFRMVRQVKDLRKGRWEGMSWGSGRTAPYASGRLWPAHPTNLWPMVRTNTTRVPGWESVC